VSIDLVACLCTLNGKTRAWAAYSITFGVLTMIKTFTQLAMLPAADITPDERMSFLMSGMYGLMCGMVSGG
jgi:hypothetical protein